MQHQVSEKRFPGGAFILEQEQNPFTPENFTDEQRMIARTASDFAFRESEPRREEIESLNIPLTRQLLRQAGEIGLLGADIPEAYGGMGLDTVSSMLITENIVPSGSFALSFGAHVGIGTLPIVLFGNQAQKQKYLPKLATGEWIAAYALTEPESGSDALNARTTSELSADGSEFILQGQKQFITNGGFADVFIVFAKVDGEKFTAFIVERHFPGVETGPEEKKMGQKGSSTTPLFLNEARVPRENVLFEVGKGHVIAFNILNIGRYKLGAGCVGSAKMALQLAVEYAKGRKQFQKPIAEFGAIREKLADMNIRTFVLESMVYRLGGLIDRGLSEVTRRDGESEIAFGKRIGKAIEEYAVECSICKVFGSETFEFCVDEAVQIHGGYGYIQEYPVENLYRGSRINRIFEGTNEINRMLIPGTMLKMALKGTLPLLDKAAGLQEELMRLRPQSFESLEGEPLVEEERLIENGKKLFLLIAGQGAQKYRENLEHEQELLMRAADLAIALYACESALLRTKKCVEQNGEQAERTKILATKVFVHESLHEIERLAKEGVAAVAEGDLLRTQQSIIRKLTRRSFPNIIEFKRQIADDVVENNGYTV